MRVIVCGSRRWRDPAQVKSRLARVPSDATIVHGACPSGIDAWVDWLYGLPANSRFTIERHPAEWKKYGRGAGPLRNQKMADLGADLCIAFADRLSGGTWDMVTRARKAKIPVEVVWLKEPETTP